jgi:hypothetical protein
VPAAGKRAVSTEHSLELLATAEKNGATADRHRDPFRGMSAAALTPFHVLFPDAFAAESVKDRSMITRPSGDWKFFATLIPSCFAPKPLVAD